MNELVWSCFFIWATFGAWIWENKNVEGPFCNPIVLYEINWFCKFQSNAVSVVHANNTVWFKINLTLFETHISHKLNSIMNLFDNIYKAWYLGMMWWKWHQNWCSNTETGALFWQIVKKNFTHTQNQWGSSHRQVY